MPFTFAHPAVVPFIKRILPAWLCSSTALVVGSIVPDFEGFLFMQTRKTFSHTWTGMFWFDLPLGMILCVLWHNTVKKGFIDNSPQFLKRRLYTYRAGNWNRYARRNKIIVVSSLLTGIATHLVWDEFTHFNGTNYSGIVVFGYEMSIFIFWQIISSIAGMLVVAGYSIHMPVYTGVLPATSSKAYWWVVFATMAAAILLKAALNRHQLHVIMTGNVIAVTVISAFMAGMLVASIVHIYRTQHEVT